jgi:hypothetical protein
VRRDLQDAFLYSAKYRPALHLDPKFRAGISSFVQLAPCGEIEAGCEMLRHHIATGSIASIIAAAEHEDGDYIFVFGER